MFKQSVGILFAVFSIQLFLVDGAVLHDASYYESIIRDANIEKFKYALKLLDQPNIGYFKELNNILSRADNDETVVKCLVEHSNQISQTITEGQEGVGRCLVQGGEKLEKIGITIAEAKKKIHDLLNEMKVLIPNCASENDNASVVLQCIHDRGIKIQNSLEEAGGRIHQSIKEAHAVVQQTGECIYGVAIATAEKFQNIGASIEKCIGGSG